MKNKLFGNKTPEEIEAFEKQSNGIIVFNTIGVNAISLQCTDGADVLLYIDKMSKAKHTSCPDTFLLNEHEIVRVYNFLAEIINSNPDSYKVIQS